MLFNQSSGGSLRDRDVRQLEPSIIKRRMRPDLSTGSPSVLIYGVLYGVPRLITLKNQ